MKIYDIRAVVGEYEKNGEVKKKYMTVGAVIETKNGSRMIKLDVAPLSWSEVYLNEPLPPKGNSSNNSNSSDTVIEDIDNTFSLDDVPF